MPTLTALKKLYSHETSIHGTDKVVGTVYTPSEIPQKLFYLLLSNHVTHSGLTKSFEINDFNDVYIEHFLKGIQVEAEMAKSIFDYFSMLKIVDLSCGTGALLLEYLTFLDFLACSMKSAMTHRLKEILETKLFGFDIEPRAISSFQYTLDAYAHQLGYDNVALNLYCLNSLTEPLPIEDASFDLIIGNPPYIGEKNNLSWFAPVKKTPFGQQYYEGKMDYFYFFIYKGHALLKPNGSLCYVSSNYFLTADGAKKLRSFIMNEFNMTHYLDFGETRIFSEKKLHACIYTLQKKKSELVALYSDQLIHIKSLKKSEVCHEDGTISFISCDATRSVLTSMKKMQLGALAQFYDINQGIVSGADAQFVYLNDQVESLPKALHRYLKPFYKNSDIDHFIIKNAHERQILYIDHQDVCPELIEWLSPYRDKLSKRREVVNGTRAWYMLTWPRVERIFCSEKIVVPQRARSNRFAFVDYPFYASADVYFITETERSPYDLKTLTKILNSNLYWVWLSNMGKKKGNLLELYATPLGNLPIPNLSDSQLEKLKKHDSFDLSVEDILYDSFNILL